MPAYATKWTVDNRAAIGTDMQFQTLVSIDAKQKNKDKLSIKHSKFPVKSHVCVQKAKTLSVSDGPANLRTQLTILKSHQRGPNTLSQGL